jgi:hypothetical protein
MPVSNSKAKQERQARLETVKQEQKSKEQKTVIAIVVGCLVLLAALGGVITFAIQDAKSKQIQNLGASVAAASCAPITTDAQDGQGEHVGPGTQKASETSVPYKMIPPSSGPHFASPSISSTKFFTAKDRPALETLVHNLEHGYTILFYDGDAAKNKISLIKDITAQANKLPESQNKFLAVEWDKSRGALEKPWVLSHWSRANGHRQFCGDLSGQVIVDFVKKYPLTDTQEPGAA